MASVTPDSVIMTYNITRTDNAITFANNVK